MSNYGRPDVPWEYLIPTMDPYVRIEDIGAGWVVYHDNEGERWLIRGQCNQCGLCETDTHEKLYLAWTNGKQAGQPGACRDTRWGFRRDIPMRPEAKEVCPDCIEFGIYLTSRP